MNTIFIDPKDLVSRLQTKADNAYFDYIELCRRDECLGQEYKIEKGIFGEAELDAHKNASEALGRHRAYSKAVKDVIDFIELARL